MNRFRAIKLYMQIAVNFASQSKTGPIAVIIDQLGMLIMS